MLRRVLNYTGGAQKLGSDIVVSMLLHIATKKDLSGTISKQEGMGQVNTPRIFASELKYPTLSLLILTSEPFLCGIWSISVTKLYWMRFRYSGSYIELQSDKLYRNEVVGCKLYTHSIGGEALEIVIF